MTEQVNEAGNTKSEDLARRTTSELIAELQRRTDGISPEDLTSLQNVAVAAQQSLDARKQAASIEGGILQENWQDKLARKALVVRRMFPTPYAGYEYSQDIFPNPDNPDGESFKKHLIPGHGRMPQPNILYSSGSYPVLIITFTDFFENNPVSIVTFRNICKGNDRGGDIDFSMYVDQQTGREFTQDVIGQQVDPEIFFNLYNRYYPPEQQKPWQVIRTGREQQLNVVAGEWHYGGKVSNLQRTTIPFKK